MLLSLVPSLALRLAPCASTRILAAGQPLFCAMPAGASSWWPAGTPWWVCQEGAALVAAMATRRVLAAKSGETARLLLSRRRMSQAELQRLAGCEELLGLETCKHVESSEAAAADALEAGSVVLALPTSEAVQPLAVAALLNGEGELLMLATDDVLERYAQLVPS